MLPFQTLTFTIHEKIKKSHTKIKNILYQIFKIIFEHISKKRETVTDNLSMMIYVNKMEQRITLEIKAGDYLELLTSEKMELLGSIKSKITKDENGENVSHLEITEVVLIHCNIANNDYQHDLNVFFTFAFNKSFGQLLEISPNNLEFLYIEVWFTDQNSKLLEIEDKINITLVGN